MREFLLIFIYSLVMGGTGWFLRDLKPTSICIEQPRAIQPYPKTKKEVNSFIQYYKKDSE